MQFPYIKNDTYQIGSPVFHVGSFIKKDIDSNGQIKKRLISIVFKNISEIQIEAIEGDIHSFNSFNEILSIDPFNQIEIPNFTPGLLYGEMLFFNVNKDAVSYKVEIKRIKYSNQDIQIYNQNSLYNFAGEDFIDKIELKQFILNKVNLNIEFLNDLYQDESLYQCVCGSINLRTNKKCYNCNISIETYEDLFTDEKMNLLLNGEVQSFLNGDKIVKYNCFDMSESEIREILSKSTAKNVVKEIKTILIKYEGLSSVIKNEINDKKNLLESGDKLIEKILSLEKKIISEKKFLEDKNIKIKQEKEFQQTKDLSDLLNTTRYEIFEKIENYQHIVKQSVIEGYIKYFEETNDNYFKDFLNSLLIKISNSKIEMITTANNNPELTFNILYYSLYENLKLVNKKSNKKIINIIEDKNPNLEFTKITTQIFDLKKIIDDDLKKINDLEYYHNNYKKCGFEWGEANPKIFIRDDYVAIQAINNIEKTFSFKYYENEFKRTFLKFKVLHFYYSSLVLIGNILLWPLVILFVAAVFALLSGGL